jgi:hypothetical protein
MHVVFISFDDANAIFNDVSRLLGRGVQDITALNRRIADHMNRRG